MAFSLGPLKFPSSIVCRATPATSSSSSSLAFDAAYIKRAAELADKSAGFTAPHPNYGCVIATTSGNGERVVVGEGYLYAQGTTPAELQAVEAAGESCRGATAYLNMEPNHCLADYVAVSALVQAGIARVVIGIRHPLPHLRGKAVRALRSEGLLVDVLGEDLQCKTVEEGLKSCLLVNAPLLYRASSRVPFSVLKYAMTLDGKIAASSGHASWISSKKSRTRVFDMRGRSDAVIVGGNTVRRDSTLAASAISSGVIHKVHAFVAPKIIGGKNAPSPVGELGMVEMSQAMSRLLNSCGHPIAVDETSAIDPTVSPYEASIIFFYKTWDPYGAFSNFSLHPIQLPDENGDYYSWPSVEHYYQAHKFVGLDDPVAKNCLEEIKNSKSPEEAARIGRRIQRQRPDLVRPDWESVKIDVMYRALKCKFSTYPNLTSMLLSTAGSVLVEASPHDLFWGGGRDGEGLNYLGRLLMQLRSEFLSDSAPKADDRSLRQDENKVQKLP
ncbi:UNVERIFIED_CONTAM: Riboflavin biosynthesis protein PYRR, chloroplastic [Sesamum radiatum]|uniref:Riboflavin biosynthesis protein PYRR, chloroplastic n=1 Tax=Sesamum radiatum TaxID=300843 RepID=A0AAW2JWV0_SESRA